MKGATAAHVGVLAFLAAVATTVVVSSQSPMGRPPAPAGAITGDVVDAQSGEPIPGALVYLARAGRGTVGRSPAS
jgi:hypothetical protein